MVGINHQTNRRRERPIVNNSWTEAAMAGGLLGLLFLGPAKYAYDEVRERIRERRYGSVAGFITWIILALAVGALLGIVREGLEQLVTLVRG